MSKMKGSPRRLPAFRPSSADPKLCARRFGEMIRHYRRLDGRPIEELAPAAGLTPAGWEEIEAGHAPVIVEQLLMLATALDLGDSCLPPLLSLCARASELWQPAGAPPRGPGQQYS